MPLNENSPIKIFCVRHCSLRWKTEDSVLYMCSILGWPFWTIFQSTCSIVLLVKIAKQFCTHQVCPC